MRAGALGRGLLGLLMGAAACSRGPAEFAGRPGGDSSGSAWRAIAADPVALDRDPAFVEERIDHWEFAAEASVPAPDDNPPLAEVAVDLPAESVQVIGAQVENLPAGTLSLWWRTAGAEYSPAASIQVQMERSREPQGQARFEVVANPNWRGRITGLRLYTEQRKRAAVRATGLELYRHLTRPEELERLLAQPWKLALGQDLRNGYLLPPGHPLRFEVKVPDAAELLFSWGLEGGVRDRFAIEVGIAPVDTAGSPTTSQIDASPQAGEPSWTDARIDLQPWRGRQVAITIQSRSDGPFNPAAGFPLLANPRIVVPRSRATRWNVILISIDTLRADHLSCYGYGRETTPRLDAWAQSHAAIFETAVAAAPSTLPSHASMLTGVEAFRHGAQHDPLALSWETLAEELRAAGYSTWGVTGGAYTSPAMGLAQGFDVYRTWVWGFERGKELPANMDWTLERLARRPAEPFFLFFHTYEVHAPLRAREPAFSSWNPNDRRDSLLWVEAPTQKADTAFRAQHAARYEYRPSDPSAPAEGAGTVQAAIDRYDSSIAFVDGQLDRLFRELERTGLASSTLVIVTSDHGESFGEHGLAGHGYLYDDNLHVPLLVSLPDAEGAGRRISRQVRSIDITPTVLDAVLGSDLPQADGASLRPLLTDPTAPFPDDAWSYAANSGFGLSLRLQGRLKYWLSDTALRSTAPAEVGFDLRSDPGETKPVTLAENSLAALRSRAIGELSRNGSGVHLEVENRTSAPARITLRGAGLSPLRLTLTALPGPKGEWNSGSGFTFALASGSRAALNLQGTANLPLEMAIVGSTGTSNPVLHLDSPVADPVGYSLVGDAWVSQSSEQARFRVTAHNVGAAETPQPVTTSAESELESQLRALGYLQ